MKLTVRRFLAARFLAMVAWVVLLMLGYLLYRTLSPHVASDFTRFLLNLATLGGSIALGLILQRRALAWLDPDGQLRSEVRAAAGHREGSTRDQTPRGPYR